MAQDRSHRYRNFGEGFMNISEALKKIEDISRNVSIIYTVSFNLSIKKPIIPLPNGIKKLITYSSSWYESLKAFVPYPYIFLRRSEKDAVI
jgi:hypothetical protein